MRYLVASLSSHCFLTLPARFGAQARSATVLLLAMLFIALPRLSAAQDAPARVTARDDPMALRFRFDGALQASAGLEFEFARGVSIVLPGLAEIASDEPRYQPPLCLAPAPLVQQVRDTAAHTDLLGSGLDHDGLTPLLLLYDRTFGNLDVFTVANQELLQAEEDGVGRNRTHIDGTPRDDLLQGAYPNKAYTPVSAAVCHGLIVVLCVVHEGQSPPDGPWAEIAMAFVISQDAGLTWELLFEDSPVEVDWPRGREWCLQNWWPMQRQTPLNAFFTATDYRANPSAQGGRTYLFSAQRSKAGAPWTAQPVLVAYETGGVYNEHFHASAAAPLAEGGMAVLTSVGDGQWHNRVVRQTRSDLEYTQPGWTIDEEFHGKEADYANDDPGREANQFVGCAPGPAAGDVLVGADLVGEQILLIPGSDLTQPHPRTRHVYGLSTSDDTARAELFLIRTPTPERGGPYFARYSPRSDAVPTTAKRVLYSPDGVDWAQVFSPATGNYRGCLHGEHIYVDSFVSSTGVRRFSIPVLRKGEPLRVGAGGVQRSVDHPLVTPGPGGTIVPLQRAPDGRWYDQGEPLDPQPPCTGQVYRITASRFEEALEAARIWLCGDAGDVGQLVPGDAIQWRAWLMNNLPAANLHPGIELRDESGNVHLIRRPYYAAVGSWYPIFGVTDAAIPPQKRVLLRVNTTSATIPDDADFYLALDFVVEGKGCADYPLPQDEALSHGGVACPDERAAITGFNCTSNWTITLAAQTPPDSWDAAMSTTDSWPLATLWADEENYIELFADTGDPEDNRLVASIVREGVEVSRLASAVTYWLRGSAVLVCVTDNDGAAGLQMTVSVGGQPAHEATVVAGFRRGSLAVPPREVRFRSHHEEAGDGTDARVTPMLWWGGEIRQTQSLDVKQRRAALETLAFLDPPPVLGDLDGDGDVDQADLGILLAAYLISDAGDVDGDGDTDQSDLGILLANYGAGT